MPSSYSYHLSQGDSSDSVGDMPGVETRIIVNQPGVASFLGERAITKTPTLSTGNT